jgi:uncharacterized protein (TIGR02001 family)
MLALPAAARAQQPAAPSPEPEPGTAQTFTANVGIFSQYSFRGISQTTGRPVVQGGFDYARAGGLYLGTWASNVSWLRDFGAYSRSSLEWDFYGGYKLALGETGVVVDLGTIYYAYPGRKYVGVSSADTWEVYAGAGWKWVSAKYSYNLKDYFGARPTGEETDGTWYLDFSAVVPAGDTGLTLAGHFGVLDVANDGTGDAKVGCNDWKLGASWAVPSGPLKDLEIGAYYSGSSSSSTFYTDLTGYDTVRDAGVVYVKMTY